MGPPGLPNAAAPRRPAPTFLLPLGNRRRVDGDALAQGCEGPLGYAGGRRRFAGPKGPQNQSRGGGQRPRPCFVRAVRARRPPGNAGIFLRPREPFANLFSPRKPTNKTSPPLPVSGGPAYAVGKPKKDSSQFSPAFLKAGQGVWGAGSPPHGVPGGRALQKAYYTLKRKSTTSPSCMT